MGGTAPTAWPLPKALELFGPPHHLALICDSEQEESAVLGPFLHVGLARGERCLYVAAERRLARLSHILPPDEVNLEAAVAGGALRVAARPRDPERLARLLREQAREAEGAFRGLRVILETQESDRPEELAARERALAREPARGGCLLLCVYDRRRVRPQSLLAGIYSHPLVIHGNMVCQNFHWRPPEELLHPEREVEWLLKNICDRERFIAALRRQVGEQAAAEALPAGCADCLQRAALLERMRGQLQRMEEVGRLAGQLAGEFNTRLTIVMGYAEMLARGADSPETHRQYAQEILRVSQQASLLTERLLDFSRRQRLTLRSLNLNELAGALLESWKEPLSAWRVEFKPAAELWPVRADPQLIQQGLEDLLAVERHRLPAGAAVTIETANVEMPGTRGELPAGAYVLLRISDDGPELDEAARNRLLEPVFQLTGSGATPGLWGAVWTLKEHGGDILVERGPEGGTRFEFFLPAAQPQR